jgi:hypothetical protein
MTLHQKNPRYLEKNPAAGALRGPSRQGAGKTLGCRNHSQGQKGGGENKGLCYDVLVRYTLGTGCINVFDIMLVRRKDAQLWYPI